jgi:cytochrome c556
VKRVSIILLVMLYAACAGGDDDYAAEDAAAGADAAHGADAGHDGSDAAHAHAESGEPQALLPIMRQLAVDMGALQQALFAEDFATVEARAAAVAQHPHIAPDEIDRIESTLGGESAAFDSLDVVVHEAAVAMHEAAREGDTDAVLDRLAEVQRGCVACHTRFRERLRTTTQ